MVRHLISIPAGAGKMSLLTFCLYTTVGACMWNMFLAYLGLRLKEHWEDIRKYSETMDVLVVILLAAAFVWFVYAHVKQIRAGRR